MRDLALDLFVHWIGQKPARILRIQLKPEQRIVHKPMRPFLFGKEICDARAYRDLDLLQRLISNQAKGTIELVTLDHIGKACARQKGTCFGVPQVKPVAL
ncbi:hypothetical protein D3C85_1473060 [compost metagenome]